MLANHDEMINTKAADDGKKTKKHRHKAPKGTRPLVEYLFQNIALVVCCNLNFCTPNDKNSYISITNSSSRNPILNPTILNQPGVHWAWGIFLLHESHEKF